MRNQVYSRYIYQMLMEFDRVCIPTLGTFTLEFTDAAFKTQKTLLAPPSSSVIFVREEDLNFGLSRLLSESGMNHEDAQRIENLAIEDIASAIKSQYPFELDGFGTIVNQVFLEKDVRIFDKYDGLADIPVTPVPVATPRIQHQDEYLFKLNNPYKKANTTDRTQYIWPILAALVTLICIGLWVFSNKSAVSPALTPTTNIVAGSITNQEDVTLVDDTLINDSNYTSETLDSITTNTVEQDVQESLVNEGAVKNGKEMMSNDSKSCVVIVGAFKNNKNANKLLKSITKRGYKTYSADHDGLKRVGVAYDCSANDPEVFKLEVRKIFNKDAWHLHDTI